MRRIITKINNFIEKTFRPVFRTIVGWDEMLDRMDAMDYIINHCIDIKEFPKATGRLRQCQLADAELLRLVHETLEKHGLSYWLDYGTLLGAVRHKGFIPWDDDLDICMTREEYDRAVPILKKELSQYGVYITDSNVVRIGLNVWNAGLILDIFPMDCVDLNSVRNKDELRNRLLKYKKIYEKKRNEPLEVFEKERENIIGSTSVSDCLWYHSVEGCGDNTIFENDTIFPLKKMRFEDYEFYVPNDCHTYLKECYGEYMNIPKGGVLHHKGGNNKPIYENSIKHNVNMDDFLNDIKGWKVTK